MRLFNCRAGRLSERARRPVPSAKRTALACEKATSTVEFAIVAPLFILFLFGIIEFGSAYSFESRMYDAARETARLIALGKEPVGGADAIVTNRLELAPGDAVVNAICGGGPGGDIVEVTIQVPASIALPTDVLGLFGGANLQAKVTMRREQACV